MSHLMQAPIIVLKEGTDSSQGIPQVLSNINACYALSEILKTTLGPMSSDKLIKLERDTVISNDGATIIKTLDVTHPVASILSDLCISQDEEVGDGTTSIVLLAGEMLQQCKTLLEEKLSQNTIILGLQMAKDYAITLLDDLEKICPSVDVEDIEKLQTCAQTALHSKLLTFEKIHFAKMAVDAVLTVDSESCSDMIGIKKVSGGSVSESFLVDGVAFKKTFSYAGFEQQPKLILNPKIALLNIELELKAEKDNAEVRIKNVQDYQSIVNAEWKIIYDKLDEIHNAGANVVLSKLPIGDLATQYFADRKIFCAGRVEEADLRRMEKATSARILSTTRNVKSEYFGTCDKFEEIGIGSERYNLFSGCAKSKTATIVVRGCGDQFMDEANRSLHDAIMVVSRMRKHKKVVGGAGSTEMILSVRLHEYSKTLKTSIHHVVAAVARALEVIPINLAKNAGLNVPEIMAKLRKQHFNANDYQFHGIGCFQNDVIDAIEASILEPLIAKRSSICAAIDFCQLLFSIDETIITNNQPNEDEPMPQNYGQQQRAGM